MGRRKGEANNMSPDDALYWKWKTTYAELLDPFTGTAQERYFYPFLEFLFSNCKKNDLPLSIAILNIPDLEYPQIRININNIKKILSKESMIFYNGEQTFLFILPNTSKETTQKQVDHIATTLAIKGGYAEFPTDAKDVFKLQECARQALTAANQSNNNNIMGYFSERRRDTRIPLKAEARYLAQGSCERLTCSRNISDNGIMLSGMPDLVLGDKIRLTLNLGKEKIIVLAKTIWNRINTTTDKMDIGLCFTSINDTTKAVIKRFISNPITSIIKL